MDPPIRLTGADVDGGDGPPTLAVGFTSEAGFVELSESHALVVIYGLQGGTWTMPTVRTRGVSSFATITCRVKTAAEEPIGAIEARTKFLPSLDGPLEVLGFPIPIAHAAPNEGAPIEDLFGQEATITCGVQDEAGRGVEISYAVTVSAP